MFETLSEKLELTFKKLRGAGRLSERNIKDAMREVRQSLLEADVNYKVARDFVKAVEAKSVGAEVLKSIEPGQQVIKVVHQKLVELLGKKVVDLAPVDKTPTVYMICGLQGSGKTTLTGKIALMNKRKKKKPLMVAADIYRPAAVKQLNVLADSIDVEFFHLENKSVMESCNSRTGGVFGNYKSE